MTINVCKFETAATTTTRNGITNINWASAPNPDTTMDSTRIIKEIKSNAEEKIHHTGNANVTSPDTAAGCSTITETTIEAERQHTASVRDVKILEHPDFGTIRTVEVDGTRYFEEMPCVKAVGLARRLGEYKLEMMQIKVERLIEAFKLLSFVAGFGVSGGIQNAISETHLSFSGVRLLELFGCPVSADRPLSKQYPNLVDLIDGGLFVYINTKNKVGEYVRLMSDEECELQYGRCVNAYQIHAEQMSEMLRRLPIDHFVSSQFARWFEQECFPGLEPIARLLTIDTEIIDGKRYFAANSLGFFLRYYSSSNAVRHCKNTIVHRKTKFIPSDEALKLCQRARQANRPNSEWLYEHVAFLSSDPSIPTRIPTVGEALDYSVRLNEFIRNGGNQ